MTDIGSHGREGHRGGRRVPTPRPPIRSRLLLAIGTTVALVGLGTAGWRAAVLLTGPGGGRSPVADSASVDRWRSAARTHLERTGNVERAEAALESLLAARPNDARALADLGVIAARRRAWERAAELYRRALAVDSLSIEAGTGLVETLVRAGRVEDAAVALSRFLRRRPDSPYPWIQRARLAWLAGDPDATRTVLDSLEARFPGDLSVRSWTARERARLDLVAGRLLRADRRLAGAVEDEVARGDPVAAIERSVDRAWPLFWWSADTARALALVGTALERWPLDSLLPPDRPLHYLAEFYAAAGRPARAESLLAAHAAGMPHLEGSVPNPWFEASWGLVALAGHRPEDAVDRFRRWDAGIACRICALGDLARALEAAGRADSARVVWRSYLATPDLQRIEWDPYYLALARERLVRLDLAAGDTAAARERGRELAAQWRDADPGLRRRMWRAIGPAGLRPGVAVPPPGGR